MIDNFSPYPRCPVTRTSACMGYLEKRLKQYSLIMILILIIVTKEYAGIAYRSYQKKKKKKRKSKKWEIIKMIKEKY